MEVCFLFLHLVYFMPFSYTVESILVGEKMPYGKWCSDGVIMNRY